MSKEELKRSENTSHLECPDCGSYISDARDLFPHTSDAVVIDCDMCGMKYTGTQDLIISYNSVEIREASE